MLVCIEMVILDIFLYITIMLLLLLYVIIVFCAFTLGYVLNTHLREEHKLEFLFDAIVVDDVLYELYSRERYII
ncbi:unnamed protein product [Meloidogyne enterolobii]|uniref:Uncharacterized protein n=3 Tax=Meloidogyne enterolobii TaxID=390850 RepID=A0ACB0ZGJ1_MELEN|nr:unnamed protein product [Meloidogyne enterolobii]